MLAWFVYVALRTPPMSMRHLKMVEVHEKLDKVFFERVDR